MIEWNVTSGPLFISIRAVRTGLLVERVSIEFGKRRNRLRSNASGLSAINVDKSFWIWSESSINEELTRPIMPLLMSEPRCGVAR